MITSIIINGILIGLIYALLAIGLTMIFGVMRIINMFHGDAVMLGMYAAYVLFDKFGISPYVSVFLTAPVFFVLGAVIYKFLIDPIPVREREITSLIITLGISFIFATSAMYVWSADYRTVTLPFSQDVMVFLETRIGYPALISSCMSAFLIVAFYFFMSKTYIGRAIRATELDKDTASVMGVNVKWISIATFGIGVVLAAMAGGVLAPIFYIYPFVGGNFVIKAFTIVVLGGMGSVTGALVGGVVLGVAEALASTFLEYSMKDIMAFILFLGILLFKPSGLLGGKTRL
jgi:branched-chain amino acid transport system permease protein